MRLAILLIISLFSKVAVSQEIESIVGVAHADNGPTVRSVGDPGDAVDIIVTWLGSYAAIECNKKLRPTLKQNLASAINKLSDTIPVGATVEFLVLTDKFKCEVIEIVPKTQTVRIQNGRCNIKDLQLTEPPTIYNPATTGFFSINVKF